LNRKRLIRIPRRISLGSRRGRESFSGKPFSMWLIIGRKRLPTPSALSGELGVGCSFSGTLFSRWLLVRRKRLPTPCWDARFFAKWSDRCPQTKTPLVTCHRAINRSTRADSRHPQSARRSRRNRWRAPWPWDVQVLLAGGIVWCIIELSFPLYEVPDELLRKIPLSFPPAELLAEVAAAEQVVNLKNGAALGLLLGLLAAAAFSVAQGAARGFHRSLGQMAMCVACGGVAGATAGLVSQLWMNHLLSSTEPMTAAVVLQAAFWGILGAGTGVGVGMFSGSVGGFFSLVGSRSTRRRYLRAGLWRGRGICFPDGRCRTARTGLACQPSRLGRGRNGRDRPAAGDLVQAASAKNIDEPVGASSVKGEA
jgi:hypothetical protein